MKHHILILATGQKIPIPVYCQAVKKAIKNPEIEFKSGLTTWWPTTGKEIRLQFRNELNDRISSHLAWKKGRKYDSDYFRNMLHTQRRINSKVILDYLPPELKKRFAHRLRRNICF